MHQQDSSTRDGLAVIEGLMHAAPVGPLTTVDVSDGRTWTLAEDTLPGGWRVVTSFSLVRFAPAWSLTGTPHYFETLVIATSCDFAADSQTYATEAEARDGHAVVLARLRTSVERAS